MNAELFSNGVGLAPAGAHGAVGGTGGTVRRTAAFVEEVHDRLLEKFVLILITPLFVIQLAVYEWMQHMAAGRPHPVALTLMSGLVAAYAAHRIRPFWKRLHQATDADDSEWRVTELMDCLPGRGYRVVSAADRDAADEALHVVVGASGIYAVCVNTRRRPRREGDAVEHVMLEGGKEKLMVAGTEVFGDPLGKAAKMAVATEKQLLRKLGRNYKVQPLLVFPGWKVESPHGNGSVWVLNEDLLEVAVTAQPPRIERIEVEQIFKALAERQ